MSNVDGESTHARHDHDREVLAEQDSIHFLAPLAQLLVGIGSPLHQLVDCFRTGDGISFGAFGADMREGQARMNRALFLYELGERYLPSIPDLHARLWDNRAARIADAELNREG